MIHFISTHHPLTNPFQHFPWHDIKIQTSFIHVNQKGRCVLTCDNLPLKVITKVIYDVLVVPYILRHVSNTKVNDEFLLLQEQKKSASKVHLRHLMKSRKFLHCILIQPFGTYAYTPLPVNVKHKSCNFCADVRLLMACLYARIFHPQIFISYLYSTLQGAGYMGGGFLTALNWAFHLQTCLASTLYALAIGLTFWGSM